MSEFEKAVSAYDNAFAIWTDRADFITEKGCVPDADRLLELRCFDLRGEYYARRDSTDGAFSVREIISGGDPIGENAFAEETYANGFFDEAQYLDIDTAVPAAADGLVFTTGGGAYHLPAAAKGNRLILVRSYYKFDADGVARKFDWRLVDFTNTETVGKGDK